MDQEQVRLHEHFIQNVNGTTINEVLWITLPSHFCTLMVIVVGVLFPSLSHTCSVDCVPFTCNKVKKQRALIFIKEIIIITIPLIYLTTIYAVETFFILIVTLVVALGIFASWKMIGFTFYLSLKDFKSLCETPIKDTRRSYITCCRSIINLMTMISILAVDFSVFPRRLAKTEAQGFSLMDVGVGYFVISNSAVLKVERIRRSGIKLTVIGSAVLFLLGFLRYYSIQRINYQKNVTEYGVHWNFFFTLGSTKLLSFLILKSFSVQPLFLGVILSSLHQLLLYLGLESYVIEDKPRDNWVDANREGLISLIGYTSLYLIGVSMNKFVTRKSTTVGHDLKIVIQLVFLSTILYVFTVYFSELFPVSRRLVSLTYITWVTSSAFLHLALSMVVESFLICFVLPRKLKSFYNHLTPIVYESISSNGLVFFLLANLLTGLINIICNTMEMGNFKSILILVLYMTINCLIICTMYYKRIHFKFW